MRSWSVLLLAFFMLACSRQQKPVSYSEQIQPILNSRCTSCHSEETPRAKIVLTSYEALSNSRASISGKQPLVIPGNPAESRLFVLCATKQVHFRMPPDTTQLSPLAEQELELLMKWITQGAKNN